MDQQMYEIACQIIDQDCTLTKELRDGKGNFCAIGGLYTAIDPNWAMEDSLDRSEEVYADVADVFGIFVDPIWLANDEASTKTTVEERRARVKAALAEQLEIV